MAQIIGIIAQYINKHIINEFIISRKSKQIIRT